jgi:hypothetical protein
VQIQVVIAKFVLAKTAPAAPHVIARAANAALATVKTGSRLKSNFEAALIYPMIEATIPAITKSYPASY